MLILGLSALTHDPAAALLSDTGIEAAMEESKLVRMKSSGGIPRTATQYCLDRAGVTLRDVDYVVVASQPLRAWARDAWFRAKFSLLAPVAAGYYQSKALGELGRELNNLRVLRVMRGGADSAVMAAEHHLCHAASAYYASPFDHALILTLDERGDGIPCLAGVGKGTKIRVLAATTFPHSVGWVYSQVTELLGFAPGSEEHKTQWLSLQGEPAFANLFLKMFRSRANPLPRLDRSYFTRGFAGHLAFSSKFYEQIGCEGNSGRELSEEMRRQLAASVQHACTTVICEIAEKFRKQTGTRQLCLAGGVFLNALLISELEKKTGFDRIFVQPAAGNPGCAPGAAWYLWHQKLNKPRLDPPRHLYWGPSYSNTEIKHLLENCKCVYRWYDRREEQVEETSRLLSEGKIVAWYQGAAEFGPRALGNRSLLASPWSPYAQVNLNQYVKHREAFRPFAVAVTQEDSAEYFDCSELGQTMSTLGHARPKGAELLRDFLMPGNRVRLHVVEREVNPLLWQLLKKSGQDAPAPLLINTSFNLFGEPAVITPREALRSFFCSGIDALAIGNFLLSKS